MNSIDDYKIQIKQLKLDIKNQPYDINKYNLYLNNLNENNKTISNLVNSINE